MSKYGLRSAEEKKRAQNVYKNVYTLFFVQKFYPQLKKRLFVLFLFIISTTSSTTTLLSYAKVAKYINKDIELDASIGFSNLNQTNAMSCSPQCGCDVTSTNAHFSRYSYIVMWGLLVPEFVSMFYSLYFIFFKKSGSSSWILILKHVTVEAIFA